MAEAAKRATAQVMNDFEIIMIFWICEFQGWIVMLSKQMNGFVFGFDFVNEKKRKTELKSKAGFDC